MNVFPTEIAMDGATLPHRNYRQVYQTSTMGALLEGVYDGEVTIRELLRHGNFGLGTFNGLDGEMLILGGICYQLRADGSATIADPEQRTPFAVLTWFYPERSFTVESVDRAALKVIIDDVLESSNLMVAVRVAGDFQEIRTRTVTAQNQPYRPFSEATRDQQVVTFADVRGTLAGFRMPEYKQGISVAGYHSHFVDYDRRVGGHTLDYHLVRGTVEICMRSELHLHLQRTTEFLRAELDRADVDTQIRRTEGG